MKVYQPAIDDWKLAVAWREMMVSQDIKSYPPCLMSLHTFLGMLQPSTSVVYEEDEHGPWLLLWAEPATWNFATVSLWLRRDKRQSKSAIEAIRLAFHHFFQRFAALLAYTTQQGLVSEYVRFGFDQRGTLPQVACGDDAYLLVLTRERFTGAQPQGEA